MSTEFEVEPIHYRPLPTRRVLASNLVEAGRAVVRASDSHLPEFPAELSYEERAALDTDLAAIDEAQRKSLETGSRYIIGQAGR